ncbi:hypothetical protein Tco_1506946 [Tanacetum coccineum]
MRTCHCHHQMALIPCYLQWSRGFLDHLFQEGDPYVPLKFMRVGWLKRMHVRGIHIIFWSIVCIVAVDAEHVVVFQARQHPLPLESEEREVLEQPEQFLEQKTVDHQYNPFIHSFE